MMPDQVQGALQLIWQYAFSWLHQGSVPAYNGARCNAERSAVW